MTTTWPDDGPYDAPSSLEAATLDDTAVVARLLDRFTFGATQAERAAVAGQSPSQVMQTLLAGVGTALPAGVTVPDLPAVTRKSKDETADAKKERREQLRAQRGALLHWWLSTATRSEHQLTERMAWFWSGHFSTSIAKVRSAALMYQQCGTLRSGGTGSFAALAQAMVVDPAMLVWLDGNDNKVGAANENLSREFLELFSLGPGDTPRTTSVPGPVGSPAGPSTGPPVPPGSSRSDTTGPR